MYSQKENTKIEFFWRAYHGNIFLQCIFFFFACNLIFFCRRGRYCTTKIYKTVFGWEEFFFLEVFLFVLFFFFLRLPPIPKEKNYFRGIVCVGVYKLFSKLVQLVF